MPTWVFILLVLIALLFVMKLFYVFSTGWQLHITKGALFVPTAPVRITSLLETVSMGSGDLFVDLGCGDGRVLKEARKRFHVRALGFEVNHLAYLVAKARTFRDKGIQIKRLNFWGWDLRGADVVFCYLFPDLMQRIGRKLERELKEGARVVSCNFPIPGWQPAEILRPRSSRHGDPIYIYQYPDACVRAEAGF